MTEKTIIECDGPDCDESKVKNTNGAVPPDWGLLINGNGDEAHLCPKHARQAWQEQTKSISIGGDTDG